MGNCFLLCRNVKDKNDENHDNNSVTSTIDDMPDIDYNRMNTMIDNIVKDLVCRYQESGMASTRNAFISNMERKLLETTIRHHIALACALILPYILPTIRGSMRCKYTPNINANNDHNQKSERVNNISDNGVGLSERQQKNWSASPVQRTPRVKMSI